MQVIALELLKVTRHRVAEYFLLSKQDQQVTLDSYPASIHPSQMEIEVSGRKVILRQIAAADTVHLRHSVLWPDKPESFVLIPEDGSGLHFGAFLNGDGDGPVSVISFFKEGLPGEQDTSGPQLAGRFRKFATAPECQGQGIGSKLLSFATSQVKAMWGVKWVWCDARVSAMDWYVKRGMHELGGDGNARFFKEHIPYLKMGMEV